MKGFIAQQFVDELAPIASNIMQHPLFSPQRLFYKSSYFVAICL